MNLTGNTPTEKHILLLKLTEQLRNSASFESQKMHLASGEERRWIAQSAALLNRVNDLTFGFSFRSIKGSVHHHIVDAQGIIMDACEELKLDLELDGRSEVGSAYDAGDIYRFYADLKEIIAGATKKISVIDPYFDGTAFDNYLSAVSGSVSIEILTSRYTDDILQYANKHKAQFDSNIEIRKSKEIHDRLIFIDSGDCWIVGASIKDAGKKPTYLIPIGSELAESKYRIYSGIYSASSVIQ